MSGNQKLQDQLDAADSVISDCFKTDPNFPKEMQAVCKVEFACNYFKHVMEQQRESKTKFREFTEQLQEQRRIGDEQSFQTLQNRNTIEQLQTNLQEINDGQKISKITIELRELHQIQCLMFEALQKQDEVIQVIAENISDAERCLGKLE